MTTAFKTAFMALPGHVAATLTDWGIAPDITGSTFLKEVAASSADACQLIDNIVDRYPEGAQPNKESRATLRNKILEHMKPLFLTATKGRIVADLEPWEATALKHTMSAPTLAPVTLPPHLVKRWRNVTTEHMSLLEPTTMRAMELKLKDNWQQRLVHILIPHADAMPEISKRLKMEDSMQELCDLFGKNKAVGAASKAMSGTWSGL